MAKYSMNPYDVIKDDKMLPLCPLLAKGAIYVIAFAWYEAGCPDLGPNPDFKRIAGMTSRSWKDYEFRITEVLSRIMPKLHRMYVKKAKSAEIHIKNLEKSRDYMRGKRSQQDQFSDKNTHQAIVTPTKNPEKLYNENRTDQVEIKRVRREIKQRSGAQKVTFTD